MGPNPVQILTVAAGVLFLTPSLPVLKGTPPGRKQVEQSIENAYKGKTLSLRNFYTGPTLEFDSNGGALKGSKVGPWTLYSHILVNGMKLKSQSLEIDAKRLYLHYLAEEKKFQAFRDGDVRIHIHLDREPSRTQDLEPTLARVFLNSGEDFSELVPPYWKEFCSHMNDPDWSEKQMEKMRAQNSRRENGAVPPVPIRKPEPPYSKEARAARINGTLTLTIVVDKQGDVSDVMLIRPLGMGLDEKAVETVESWRFEPARLNGQATAVKLVVEVRFRLY
jgi:TonB family protein